MIKIIPITNCILIKGIIHLSHFPYGTLAIARPASKNPETGVNTLDNPFPIDNAKTAIYIIIPLTFPIL